MVYRYMQQQSSSSAVRSEKISRLEALGFISDPSNSDNEDSIDPLINGNHVPLVGQQRKPKHIRRNRITLMHRRRGQNISHALTRRPFHRGALLLMGTRLRGIFPGLVWPRLFLEKRGLKKSQIRLIEAVIYVAAGRWYRARRAGVRVKEEERDGGGLEEDERESEAEQTADAQCKRTKHIGQSDQTAHLTPFCDPQRMNIKCRSLRKIKARGLQKLLDQVTAVSRSSRECAGARATAALPSAKLVWRSTLKVQSKPKGPAEPEQRQPFEERARQIINLCMLKDDEVDRGEEAAVFQIDNEAC
ncbi:hypothetical protein TSAR_010155 [Trichomalopsis sarcophagae]|uniref:Uncharacterized protein n=1 Tax=Trichomalopsis sarcophagae TaxID=543379 RepID=A0A232FMJ7_9HYME|nr:hypothetical protein TSAR_010155 [Trichomalopsis sarcophagae]